MCACGSLTLFLALSTSPLIGLQRGGELARGWPVDHTDDPSFPPSQKVRGATVTYPFLPLSCIHRLIRPSTPSNWITELTWPTSSHFLFSFPRPVNLICPSTPPKHTPLFHIFPFCSAPSQLRGLAYTHKCLWFAISILLLIRAVSQWPTVPLLILLPIYVKNVPLLMKTLLRVKLVWFNYLFRTINTSTMNPTWFYIYVYIFMWHAYVYIDPSCVDQWINDSFTPDIQRDVIHVQEVAFETFGVISD